MTIQRTEKMAILASRNSHFHKAVNNGKDKINFFQAKLIYIDRSSFMRGGGEGVGKREPAGVLELF